jgi:acyl carrier protein
MNIDIFNRIKEFTVDQMGVDENDVTENTLLETDLNIYGDDAVEYLVAFGKKFNVDMSNFMAASYFSAEGGVKLFPGIRQLFGIKKVPKERELKIKHLVKSVEMGKLDEEVIRAADS